MIPWDASYQPLSSEKMWDMIEFAETQADDQLEGIREDMAAAHGPRMLEIFDKVLWMRKFATEAVDLADKLVAMLDRIDPVTSNRLRFNVIDGGNDGQAPF